MRRGIVGLAALVGLGGLAGCSQLQKAVNVVHGTNGVHGSGNVVTKSVTVTGFHSLNLMGSGSVKITQGATESLTITADDNILPLLISDVKDGELTLDIKHGKSINSSKPVQYDLTVKSLDQIHLNGSGQINSSSLKGDSLKVDLTGSGDISLAGSADAVTVELSGSGQFVGTDMKCKTAKVTIGGSGKAILAPKDTLDIDISGSGSVEYFGTPKVTKNITGSGTIEQH
ncbi:MAG: head GIN domain-containing protein [Chthonomonadales bacterium]